MVHLKPFSPPLFSIICLLFIISACDFKTAESYVIEADARFEEGAYKESIALLDIAIEKDPEYIGAYINRGSAKAALNMDKSALSDYKKVLALDTANPLALFNIGNTYKRMEFYDSAVHYFSQAVESKGGYHQFKDFAMYLDYEEDNYFNLGEYDVPMMNILYGRAHAWYSLDSIYESLMDFSACVQHQFEPDDSNYMVGLCLLIYGQNDEACEFFQISAEMGYDFARQALDEFCN